MEVEIHNFQSIREVRLKANGFTTIVGRSNIGKSAIVRAIKCALTNPPGTSFVRHDPDTCARFVRGAKKCKCSASVRIVADGWDILWEKGDSVNQYVVNQSTYDKAERGTPDFLKPAFDTITVGDDKCLLQVGDQFKPIFLLDQSGGVVADVLSDVAHLDEINTASRLVERDRKEAASTRKVRERDIEVLQVHLDAYTGLDKSVSRAKDVVQGHASVLEMVEQVNLLARYSELVATLVRSAKKLQEVLTQETPDIAPIEIGETDLGKLIGYQNRLDTRSQEVGALEGVDVLVLPDLVLEDEFQIMQALEGWVAKLRTFKTFSEQTKSMEGLSDPSPEPMQQTDEQLQKLCGLANKLVSVEAGVFQMEAEIVLAEEEVKAAQVSLDDLGICPTCLKPISGHSEHP